MKKRYHNPYIEICIVFYVANGLIHHTNIINISQPVIKVKILKKMDMDEQLIRFSLHIIMENPFNNYKLPFTPWITDF